MDAADAPDARPVPAAPAADAPWPCLKRLVLDALASPHSRRAYNAALDQFLDWFQRTGQRGFSKAAVQQYCRELASRGLAAATVAQKLAAIRKLAQEAADNGLIAPETAAAVGRVRGPRRRGQRLGTWFTADEAAQLVALPDRSAPAGKRDYALLALALTTGLRRGEIAALGFHHLQRRDGRWVLLDIAGKHNRVRSVVLPDWVKLAIDDWTAAAGLGDGALFRSLDRRHPLAGRLSPQAIYKIVAQYTARFGRTAAPHDLRRSHARIAFRAGAPLEQIQFALGHASVETTMRYVGARQDLLQAPCDFIRLPAK